jgi:diguanylate cyclase (GGDEF)-like protein/PAS domain S-box-containing protein
MAAQRYLSLKWKVMAAVSLALVLVSGLSIVVTDATLKRNHEADRATERRRDGELVGLLLDRAHTDLLNLAEVFASADGVRSALEAGAPGALHTALAESWERLSVAPGLDALRVFEPGGGLLASLGTVAMEEAGLAHLALEALRAEAPKRTLLCHDGCYQVTAVPVLRGGRSVGALLLARGLAEVMLEFHLVSGADLALATPGKMTGAADRFTALGGLRLLAVSGGPEHRDLLGRALRMGDLPVSLRHAEKHVEVYPANTDVKQSGAALWLILRDISADQAAIARTRGASAALGAGALLVSVALLFVLLRPPMRRLAHLAGLMPMLGQERFDDVREALKTAHGSRYDDEISVLDRGTADLALRLKHLHAEAARHNDDLSALVSQLSRERDFIGGVLDTAQVLILTQDGRGRIRMANAYAHEISGLDHGALIGADFAACLVMPDEAQEVRAIVAGMDDGDSDASARHEAILPSTRGGLRDIVWQHSRLGVDTGSERLILSVGMDMTDVNLATRRASYLAEFDELTGLLNRATFQRELARMLEHGVIARGTLIVFDLDDFTAVNDLGGHAAGDRLLTQAATRIRGLVPQPLLAARLGSDDFALLFPDLPTALAIQLARFIIQGMAPPGGADSAESVNLSACAGIALFPDHGSQVGALLANADFALTQARAKGRGSWHVYSSDDQTKSQLQGKAQGLALIERGLHQGAFELHFQPIMNIASGACSHYEALLRVRDAQGALIPPGLFIPVAEETGVIREVDRWVLRHAISRLIGLSPAVHLSVNLSGRTLADPELLSFISGLLHQSQITPARLILEVTETVGVTDFDAAAGVLRQLRGLGCAIALDDFGAGFSSFQYLRLLPLDFVKIDGAFIRDLDKNPDDQVFVRALTEAAHGYGKLAIAEFVENAAILELLRGYGVDFAQGYFIGKPAPTLMQSGKDALGAA